MLSAFSRTLSAVESYTVIKVIGTILLQKTGIPLVSGDVILINDPIIFKTLNSKASVISSEKGRMVLSADGNADKLTTVKSSLIPPMSNIASRNGPILSISDVQSYFSGDYVLIKQAKVNISRNIFPMNDSCFFFMTYKHNGEDINKKLPFNDETLILDRNEVFKVDNAAIESSFRTPVKLRYQSGGGQTLLINELVFISPEIESLKKEIGLIIKQRSKQSDREIIEDVNAYINEFYGKTDIDHLKDWLNTSFGLKS